MVSVHLPSRGFVIATGNRYKADEIERAIGGQVCLIRPHDGLPSVEETFPSLEGNALKKARSAVKATGLSALADDTALEIDALNGRPGLYTARFAEACGSFSAAARHMLREIEDISPSKKTGRFLTVAVAVLDDGREFAASGLLEGTIADAPMGEGGFGFDSIFKPLNAGGRTLAELTPSESLNISHRAAAFRQLARILIGNGLT